MWITLVFTGKLSHSALNVQEKGLQAQVLLQDL